MDFLNIEKWATRQWRDSNLGDARRNKRAIKLAISLLKKPEASLPNQVANWKDLKAAYRLLSGSEKVNHQELQKEHRRNVYNECVSSKKQVVLFIQDTTQIDYTGHKSLEGVGPIGDHRGRGIMLHTTLAIAYDTAKPRVIGLADQHAWIRKNISLRKIEKRSDKFKRKTEADNWQDSLKKIGMPDEEHRWVNIGDRGNDIFTFMRYCKNNSWNYVVRAAHDRKISIEGERQKLFTLMRQLPGQAFKKIYLRGRNGEKGREVLLNVSWSALNVLTPKNGFRKEAREEIKTWCIRCWEEAESGLEWILLTNMEIINNQDALEKIEWYATRWLIEEYHKCLKTGCSIEKRQLRSAQGLLALLGILAVIATKLLEIKYLAREYPTELAKNHVPLIPLKLISSHFKLSQDNLTLRQFWRKIAQLGGFIGRKSDGEPGWQTLWKGWLEFLNMLRGVEAFLSVDRCG